MNETPQHPGRYVRECILPKGMKVTKAAEVLGISRPALSNFLNGKADLSAEMATRIETAFGVRARQLLDLQSDWDSAHARPSRLAPIVKSYVPPFLQIKAARIEEWADSGILPRHRLSVFLRTLVNSTGIGISLSDFPGNDSSEQPGWDGQVIAEQATPWVPEGRSGWEFGVTQNIKAKADGDFAKSVKAISDKPERMKMTFVFVTPRIWPGKDTWVKAQKAKKFWKDVRAFDASDLEQWLEQSISGQVWFAAETGQEAAGAISLDEAWKQWAADCDPELSPQLFADVVTSYQTTFRRVLNADEHSPTIISADSRDEALAFLSAALSPEDAEFGRYRDRVVIFREAGTFVKLAAKGSNFIPVILSREVEKEFAPFRTSMPSFIVYPRNAAPADPNIVLETLNHDAFEKALKSMGLEKDRIDQLSRESGRSPTVLRRRLSNLQAIQTPEWAVESKSASDLIPFIFAGAWKADNKTDQFLLEALAGDVSFDELEKRLANMLLLDSAPVWSTGSFCGVISKIDGLFAIKALISTRDLERFFEVAELVLSEDDPALDLPEKDQWAAAIYGKKREISGALRDGIAETLVLLAVYGEHLFRPRLSFDTTAHATKLVRSVLTPFSARTLEAQSDNLPLYAEAAPDEFLSLILADLKLPDSAAMALMRPTSEFPFGRAPRTGLLWALENLAWSPDHFMRTVLALGRLGEKVIDDNLTNKPTGSLSSIFRSWMPQTSVDIEARKAALTRLAERFPTVAWPICLEQFSAHSGIGHYSHKPRWRPDGHGSGEPVNYGERNDFALHAFKLARDWPAHARETIGDLVSNMAGLDEAFRLETWDVVDRWADSACDLDRAWLREKIRTTSQTRRAAIQRGNDDHSVSDQRARQAYERLQPTDPILRNEWLFRQAWVEESWSEIVGEDIDFDQREKRIAQQREVAVQEVLAARGVQGLIELAEHGQASHNVGWALASAQDDDAILSKALVEVVDSGDLAGVRAGIISGALQSASQRDSVVLREVAKVTHETKLVPLLAQAPFQRSTWDLVEEFGGTVADRYWRDVNPGWNRDIQDIAYAVRHLMEVGRPRAAFQFIHFDMKELPPRMLFDLLREVAQSKEPSGTYMLQQYYLQQAFDLLNDSGGLNSDELAGLEFAYIDIFSHGEKKPVNLERQIAVQPELFIQAVAFAFRRSDDGIDPPELQVASEGERNSRASACYTLLNSITLIPGEKDGVIDTQKLTSWVEQTRAGLAAIARVDIGDQMIGQLLSHAPADDDGIWPCLPVRDALEHFATEHIQKGVHVALANSRGVHTRGEGGMQERELAAKYRRWADAMEFTHPHVAAIMHRMEKDYLRQAEWEDNDARIARRMRH